MGLFSICCSNFATLSRAAAKAAASRLRSRGVLQIHPNWSERAILCERCPMRVVHKGTSYCGKPYLQKRNRDDAIDGCGCPTREKARDPSEHCPVNLQFAASRLTDDGCDCRWCRLTHQATVKMAS
jgi:hypothetical protein